MTDRPLELFLAGDVAIGRGIDQILPHPSEPILHEPYVKDARDYVRLAEAANGPIPRRVDPAYPWGDALDVLARERVDARIVNLETSVTTSEDHDPEKGIHYRMHPVNVACLVRLGVDVCGLANNHVMDWGVGGLVETLATLDAAGLAHAGAGLDRASAEAPAVVEVGDSRRVLVFAYGFESSGVPRAWAATVDRPGVRVLASFGDAAIGEAVEDVARWRRAGDVVVASLHWGGNWGHAIPIEHRRFAHRLVEEAGIDAVHGHSSHHPIGIEIHRGRPILYGCGDLLNDYEGIAGHERYRGDLSLLYFVSMDPATGALVRLRLAPMRMRRLRLEHASEQDARFLRDVLSREGRALGTGVELEEDGMLHVGVAGRT